MYKPFAHGVVMPWTKLAIALGICCLGRNIEIKDLKFSDFERRKSREVDELEVTLERAKAENGNRSQNVIINEPLFLKIYDDYVKCFSEEQKENFPRVYHQFMNENTPMNSKYSTVGQNQMKNVLRAMVK